MHTLSCESAAPPTWVIHCDGSALPNPGRMGLGAVIVAPDGSRQILSEATHCIGCNNEAELRAVMTALRRLPPECRHVMVYSDNSILVDQLRQTEVKPLARLAVLFDEARSVLTTFETVTLQWIPRHRNSEADALARGSLGLGPKMSSKTSKAHRHRS